MARIDVRDLVSRIGASQADADRTRREEEDRRHAKRLIDLETSMAGVEKLFGLARYASVLEGMPNRVKFEAPNGYLRGYGAERREGLWRIRLDDRNLASYEIPSTNYVHGHSLVGTHLAEALGVRWSAEASRGFASVYEVPSVADLPVAWKAMRPFLPAHVVSASMGFGSAIAAVFGLGKDTRFDEAWIDILVEEGVRPDDGVLPSCRTPLSHLSENRNPAFLAGVLTRFPLAEMAEDIVHDALSRAAADDRLDVLKLLKRNGAKLHGRDAAGWNLLHDALRLCRPGSFHNKRHVVGWLLREGVSAEARDVHGRTPGAHLSDHLFEGEGRDEPYAGYEKDEVAELCRMLGVEHDFDRGPSW